MWVLADVCCVESDLLVATVTSSATMAHNGLRWVDRCLRDTMGSSLG